MYIHLIKNKEESIMLGKDLIKAILDNALVDEDIRIIGYNENDVVDLEAASNPIEDVSIFEIAEGEVAAILVGATIS